jgi:hypothetical protein
MLVLYIILVSKNVIYTKLKERTIVNNRIEEKLDPNFSVCPWNLALTRGDI